MRLPGGSRPPAPSIPPSSITAPSSTVAPMPTKARSCSVQAWMMQAWPTVTSAPMKVGMVPALTWTMVPSWMLERAPIRMRVDVAAQHAAVPDARFLPEFDVADHEAVGATQAVGWMPGPPALEGEQRPRSCRALQAGGTSDAPSMRPRFCTAAPEAPLPRLSSRATSTAWRRASLPKTRSSSSVGVVQRLGLQLAIGLGGHHAHPGRCRRNSAASAASQVVPATGCPAACPGAAGRRPACPGGSRRRWARRSAGASGRSSAASPAHACAPARGRRVRRPGAPAAS